MSRPALNSYLALMTELYKARRRAGFYSQEAEAAFVAKLGQFYDLMTEPEKLEAEKMWAARLQDL